LICEKIAYPELEEVKSLDETKRGASGFGSTGIN
jgi:dUTP pyrophosphatase